ncbi:MAG: YbhB/YbcL family Raf kinase inhibitor-like protein [Acidobacteriia bacterium]|nr:YbhB/YbcL family Raf kinase inhibitor-like protein [Terriglobia bacterium]
MTFHLTSPAFESGEDIPKEFTCDGPDSSPPLIWTAPPPWTETLALIVDDPDAPSGTWVHWVLYNLPPIARGLPECVAKDRQLPGAARQGRNDFGKLGYSGPCPPRGAPHRYFFKLYALDCKVKLKLGASKGELERAMKRHVLAKAEPVGRFQH